ncbi:MAG: LysR family transcriptional regulator, partial [Adlercreutzia sp.]|nr:LysR family transcriptional regulator [Adlercreutzia sp.]
MDTEKCTVLLTAIDQGSLSGAAEALGYTPSGVSRLVASLEAELGLPLLVRGKGGVTPTPECEALRPRFAELASLGRACRDEAAAVRGLLTGQRRAQVMQQGAVVVLAGAVNAGKSSLLNALLGRNRALVT